MILTKEIENAIDALGIADAEICIHSSMKSFGDELEDGAKGVVAAFLKKGCTVMVPTFSYEYLQNPVEPYMPKRNGVRYDTVYKADCDRSKLFDPSSKSISVECMGVLPRCVLEDPASRRGYHPINSFTAVGRYAERLTASQTPRDVYAPFQRLMEDDGYVLLMGVGLERATILHYAEQLSGRNLFIRWANDANGRVIPIPGGGCSNGFGNFQPLLTKQGEVLVGKSLWQCYSARELVDVCRKAILENPRIAHCGNPECQSCNDAVAGGPIIDFDF